MKAKMLAVLLVTFLYLPVLSQQSNQIELPYSIDDQYIKPLRHLLNKDLQQRLEKSLNQNKIWAKLIGMKKMAVGLVDISNPYNIKFARVNGEVMMYAASLPKLAILLAGSQAIEDGTLKETPAVDHDIRVMISRSDNRAATRMIDRLGFKKIASVLTDRRYELYDVNHGGGLWVGKRYAKTGKRYPDPLMGISHGATVTQVCRFYYLLAMGKLVSHEESIHMLEALADPELHHKFVNTLDHLAPAAKLYRKSGTWRNWHADSVLVWGPVWRRYIVVGLIEDARGEQILRDLISTVEEVLNPNGQLFSQANNLHQ